VGEQRLDVGLNGNPVPAQPGSSPASRPITAEEAAPPRCQDNAVPWPQWYEISVRPCAAGAATIARMSDMETSPASSLPV